MAYRDPFTFEEAMDDYIWLTEERERLEAERDTLREQLAEAKESLVFFGDKSEKHRLERDALQSRLAEIEKAEPIYWLGGGRLYANKTSAMFDNAEAALTKLYAAPVAAPALTDEQIEAIWIEHGLDECDPHGFARAIESAVRGKL